MHTALSLAAAIFICLPSLLAQNIRAVDGYYSDPHPAAGRGIGEDIPSKKLPDEFEIHSRTPEISRDTEETISLVEDVLRERILSSSDDLISSGFQTSEDEGAVYYSAASSEDSLVLPASQEVHEREYARRLEAGIEPSDDEARDLQTPPTEKLHRARQVTAATAAPARRGPHPSSPCPSIFSYEGTKVGRQRWYGVILITTTETLTGVRLEVVLDKRANLLGAWLGEVSSVDNIHYTIWNGRRKVEPGPPLSVKIFVNYNENEPTPPKLKAIRLNGREICAKNNVAARPVGANGRPTNSAAVSRPKPVNTRPSAVARPSTTARPLSTIRTPSRPIAPVRPATKPTQNNPGAQSSESTEYVDGVACGKVDAQAAPLITHGQKTARGQWPWHAAIYKSRGADLTYICGGSLIGKKIVLTAAHCVSHSHIDRPVSADELVVYLGKYHLKLWSEGGVQDKQVYEVHMHPEYNSTDFHADIAILVLSSPVDFSMYVKPICLWDKNRVQLREVEGKEGVVVGWGYDENGLLTEDLMMAKMPVVSQQTCIWSYPQFFSHFTSDRTFCAGFRNGTSVCNGDSGGGMVFPKKEPRSGQQVTWALRGIVSLSTSLENQKVCNTKHYVVFTDVVKFYDWIQKYR